MEVKDKNGKTLDEFLKGYDPNKYPRPSVTVDMIILCKEPLGVLLVRRGGHPFLGDFALPGGFVNPTETCETAAARELSEETGVKGMPMKQIVTVSTPNRDPRTRIITVAFAAILDSRPIAVGGDDATDARWFDIEFKKENECVTLSLRDGLKEFNPKAKMKIVRDAFGGIDFEKTQIAERELFAGDHCEILLFALEALNLI